MPASSYADQFSSMFVTTTPAAATSKGTILGMGCLHETEGDIAAVHGAREILLRPLLVTVEGPLRPADHRPVLDALLAPGDCRQVRGDLGKSVVRRPRLALGDGASVTSLPA